MKARHAIANAAYGPDALKVIFRAFDAAWDEIRPNVSKRALALEAARLALANIVLSIATDDSRDANQLKIQAVRLFVLKRPISN